MSEASKRKVGKPELRFKGFEEEWSHSIINNIANRYDNQRIPIKAELRVRGTTPYYGANGILDYVEGYTHEGEFVLVAEDGANDLKNYPVQYVTGCIWVNNHAHVLQSKPDISDNQFLSYSISRADIESLLVGGGRSKLNAATLMDITLCLPTLPEQKQMGVYFRNLDTIITHHQQKHTSLQNLKKAMLEKMFPRDGADVPEIRFKGFEGAWVSRTVKELTIELSEYLSMSSGLPLLTSSRNGLIYQNEYRGNLTTKDMDALFSVVPVGACTYRHMSDDDIFHLNINTLEKGLVSPEYPVFIASKDTCLNFVVLFINSSSDFRTYCAERKKGGTRTRLYYNDLCKFSIMIPDKYEQDAIAEYFQNLDNLISHQQKKLDHLKHLKAALLDKMFVSEKVA